MDRLISANPCFFRFFQWRSVFRVFEHRKGTERERKRHESGVHPHISHDASSYCRNVSSSKHATMTFFNRGYSLSAS